MSCTERWAHTSLERLALGELSADELTRLRAHARDCSQCRTEYDRCARVESLGAGGLSGLSPLRMESLRAELLGRVAEAEMGSGAKAPAAEEEGGWRWFIARWRVFLAPVALGAAALAVVVFIPRDALRDRVDGTAVGIDESGYQARSGAAAGTESGAWGVRAFCVAPTEGAETPRVLAEAGPGDTLKCAAGQRLQFTATAGRPARLELEGLRANGGEPLKFVAAADPDAALREGVDVALPFSTPVSAGWLEAPVLVRARFLDADSGQLLGESQLTLSP